MSDVDPTKDEAQIIEPDAEGTIKVEKDSKGEFPKVVPASQYIGTKESLGKKIQAAEARATEAENKIKGLEEKLGNATSADEVTKLKEELETTKSKLQETTDNLTAIQSKSLTEKRDVLIKRGLPEDKVKDMSEKELEAAVLALGHSKPSPDLGGGGGGGETPSTSKSKMKSGFETLHPVS